MDLGQTNAMHNHILDFSSNIHHVYSSLLKLKTIFQVSSVERRRLGLGFLFPECSFLYMLVVPGLRQR